MTQNDPYKAYIVDSILNESPVGLVVALYQGAIEASEQARKCLASGDIPARTKAINKVMNITSELMRALNDEKGGDISRNLRRLYLYVQAKVVEAHTKKKAAPLVEVEKLLSTVLEGWRVAEANLDPVSNINLEAAADVLSSHALTMEAAASQYDYGYRDAGAGYGGYF